MRNRRQNNDNRVIHCRRTGDPEKYFPVESRKPIKRIDIVVPFYRGCFHKSCKIKMFAIKKEEEKFENTSLNRGDKWCIYRRIKCRNEKQLFL